MTTLSELKEWVNDLIAYHGDDKGVAVDEGGLCLVLLDNDCPWIERADQGCFEIGGVPLEDDED